MPNREGARIAKLLADIDKNKTQIAKLRDALRNQFHDLEDVLESLDQGIDCFEDGRRSFEDGLEEFSKYV